MITPSLSAQSHPCYRTWQGSLLFQTCVISPPHTPHFLYPLFHQEALFPHIDSERKRRGYKTHRKILISILGVSIQERTRCFVFYIMVTILAGRQAGRHQRASHRGLIYIFWMAGVLSIFSCTCWPFVHAFWRNVCSRLR